jgi:hypothetical protein|tara:strand:- start:32 stop:1174 length:1143 start_codon:yes stop_codon:yes gene_type:complete
MDKELAQLHDYARELLVGLEDDLKIERKATGREPSLLKKVRKAVSNLDLDPQAYPEAIEAAGGDAKKLTNAIRRMEMNTMKAWELLADDTIHHLVQQRTGGSTLARAKGDVVRGAIQRLQDKYGMRFGQATGERGVIRGDTALSNFAHKADDKATGLERASGIGKNPDASTTAHRFGTAGYASDLSPAEIADEKALFEALDARIGPQLADFEVAKATDAPRVQAIRKFPGLERAYMPDNTQAEIAEMRKIARSPAIEPGIIGTYQELILPKTTAHGVKMSFPNRLIGVGNFGMSVISEYGDAIDEITGGAITNTINKAVVNPVRKALGQEPAQSYQKPDPMAGVSAIKRAKEQGPKLSVQFGSMKVTLPELGISEQLGLN